MAALDKGYSRRYRKVDAAKTASIPKHSCGSCAFARPLDDNDAAILCGGAPPTVTAVVGNMITSHRPLLAKTEQACALWRRA